MKLAVFNRVRYIKNINNIWKWNNWKQIVYCYCNYLLPLRINYLAAIDQQGGNSGLEYFGFVVSSLFTT